MVRLGRLPQHVTDLSCSKCSSKIPLLERLLPGTSAGAAHAQAAHAQADAAGQDEGGEWGQGEVALGFETGGATQTLLQEEAEDDGAWLAIYGDLMSLLLVFFVLLFAISTVDRHKFDLAIGSISAALGGPGQGIVRGNGDGDVGTVPVLVAQQVITDRQKRELMDAWFANVHVEQASFDDVKQRLQLLIDSYELSDEFEIIEEPDSLVVVARDAALFDSGSADLNPRYVNSLWEIGYTLSSLPNKVVVEGHTDDVPISNERFASNWELSAARATSVVRLFLERAGFEPERIAGSGVAYFRPRYPLHGPRAHLNRRVEIRVQKRYPSEIMGDMLK